MQTDKPTKKTSILKKRKQQVDKEQQELNKKQITNDGNAKKVTIQEQKGKKNKNKNEKDTEQKEQKNKDDEIIDEKQEQEEQKKEKQPRLWSYEGERNEQNMFHGKGVYTFRSGSKYEGEFQNGKRHGYGILVWTNNEKYEGYWADNKRHGKGKFVHANGDTYEGEFDMDKMHGQGKYVHTCGDTYEGRYVDDKMEAFGTYTWADGQKYVGIRVENKREGEGTMYYNNGLSFKAIWHFNDVKEILEINDPNEKHKIKPLKQDKFKYIKSFQFGVNEETSEDSEKEKQKQVKCNLCIIRYKKKAIVKQLPCGCKFHDKCADIWLKYDHRCPTCRKKVKSPSDKDEE